VDSNSENNSMSDPMTLDVLLGRSDGIGKNYDLERFSLGWGTETGDRHPASWSLSEGNQGHAGREPVPSFLRSVPRIFSFVRSPCRAT
jgi:hypothetical protein